MRILIAGGVAAGASAAAKARRTNEDAEIIIFEKGKYVSFANCGLPYFIGGEVPELDDLLLVTVKLFQERFRIEVRLEHEVVNIDPAGKTILVAHGGVVTRESYDKLILATGCAPVIPPVPGAELPEVHTVSTITDAQSIAGELDGAQKQVVVVGGGFIGVETAECLAKRGVPTTLVEAQAHVLTNFDPDMVAPVERQLKRLGVKLRLKKGLSGITGSGKVEGVTLEDGTAIAADMVIMAVGMRPVMSLAKEAGLALGPDGGILTDDRMQTSQPDIYAAGDITDSLDLVTGRQARNPLAGSANKQGRTAGACAAGGELSYRGAQGTAIVRVGEITIARTGLGEAAAREAGLNCFVSYTSTRNHASFYPNAQYMILKLVVEEQTGRLLGAQAVGREGVDKRIDVLAAAVYARMSVFDLEQLDLAYAPPFSAARDPVLMAGMAAANIVRGVNRSVTTVQLRELQKDDSYQIIDVRRSDEFLCGGIRGAVNIPIDQLRERVGELDRSKKYILYCSEGYRSYLAGRLLTLLGYDAANLSGGYRAYTMDV